MSEELKLYGFDCPFVERTRLLLALKQLDYEYTRMQDFNPAPDWFLALNPLGKVPVLIHREQAIYESAIINEYLEDCFPKPTAFSKDPAAKALARILIDYCGKSFVPAMFGLLMNREQANAEAVMTASLESWRWLNTFLVQHNRKGILL
ncbi:glutathione S-transferase family protein [Oceanicoccus sp. KOV_DT_Chl]|uniref:glutathione S-transferase family protein n=1 Tax=Oceanicoccus sp. KOV_DT_Chl TaxID=1904639 RepID=UPI001357763F|nr:glutathione S-transferase N-terminal domain-containing protein [Oceanicoccus sp. KOV_DT_Chl]